jgi:hypothetical protein
MSCRWCKIITGAVILAALTAAVAALVSSGGGALPIWIKFVTWLGGVLGIEGTAALRVFGYKLFATLMALGAALVYILADVIDWLLCKICQFLGSCGAGACPPPTLKPKP